MSNAKKITSLLIFSIGLCSLTTNMNAHPFSFLWICSSSSSKVGVYDPSTRVVYDFDDDVSDSRTSSGKGTASTLGFIQSTPNPSADGLCQLVVQEKPTILNQSSCSPAKQQTSPTRRRLRDQSIQHIIVAFDAHQSQDLRRMALGHPTYKYVPANITYIN